MGKFSFKLDRIVGNYNKSDILFIISVILLWGLGFFTQYFCTQEAGLHLFDGDRYYFIKRQLVWSVLGLVAMVALAHVSMDSIRRMLPVIVIGVFVACLLVFVPKIGIKRNGAYRWIGVGGFSLQPSEFAKFAVILFMSNLFCKQKTEDSSINEIVPAGGLVLFVLIVLFQKDFSTSFLIIVVGVIMFFVSDVKQKNVWILSTLGFPLFVFYILVEPYRLNRIISFFKPEDFTDSMSYQSMASQRAIQAGGIFGNGIGSGLDDVFKIPEVQADYIFAGWADAMGLVGVSVYFILLLFFAWRGLCIAFSCKNPFASYASFGCVSMIILQSICNCGVVSGAFPTTGIPLPFFSSGGSSLFITLCMCGFVINASHCDYTYDDL